MQQLVMEVVSVLRQALAAGFRFIETVWAWASVQVSQLMSVPFQSWTIWKQILFVIIALAVAAALFRVVMDLLAAAGRIVSGIGMLAGAVLRTLPSVALAGAIAVGGLWLLNHFDGTSLAFPRAADLSSGR